MLLRTSDHRSKMLRAGQAGSEIEKSELESTSKTKTRNEILVAALIDVLEVIQKPAPTIDHAEQSPSRVMILPVRTEMLGELTDPGRQQRNLDFG
jgi:hypothetical protein